MSRRWCILAVSLIVVLAGPAPRSSIAGAGTPPSPVVLTAPPDGVKGFPLWDSYYDLEPFGYTETEFFVEGTAADASGTTAPFTTRIIVTHPADAEDFNGTVLLDWVNVTAQFENAVDTMLAREMLMREGFAYVHVSAQQAGICCLPGLTPQTWDPVRYADLSHPGDDFAFDMFTQIARSFSSAPQSGSLDPMGTLGFTSVERVIAAGQSQSGIRLHDYVNSWLPTHPEAVGAVDGFLVHGDVGKPKTFDVDVPVPVLNLLSDFEAVDDGLDLDDDLDPNVRVWEVAGTAHADLFIGYQSEFGHGPRVAALADKTDRAGYDSVILGAGNYGEQVTPLFALCTAAGASFPMRYATSTALFRLDRWIETGEAPPNGPRYEFADGMLARDADANALGGIRLPPIDVPVASYRSTDCQLGGITIPFTEVELLARYGDFATYHALMAERTDASVADGWLLPEDAIDLMTRACAASNRFLEPEAACPAYVPPAFDQPLPAAPAEPTPTPLTAPASAPALASGNGGGPALPATGAPMSLLVGLAFVITAVAVGTRVNRR